MPESQEVARARRAWFAAQRSYRAARLLFYEWMGAGRVMPDEALDDYARCFREMEKALAEYTRLYYAATAVMPPPDMPTFTL